MKRGIASLILLMVACGGTAQSFDNIEELGVAIEEGTEIVCDDWQASEGPNILPPFIASAGCDGSTLLYLTENHADAIETVETFQEMWSDIFPNWYITGENWAISCTGDRAGLDCTAIHEALGGELTEPAN